MSVAVPAESIGLYSKGGVLHPPASLHRLNDTLDSNHVSRTPHVYVVLLRTPKCSVIRSSHLLIQTFMNLLFGPAVPVEVLHHLEV